jgi:TolB-like protein
VRNLKLIAALTLLGQIFIASVARCEPSTTRPSACVAIAPFEVIGDANGAWLGRAIQDALASGFNFSPEFQTIELSPNSAGDRPAFQAAARSLGADHLIVGTVQRVQNQIRITGSVIPLTGGQRPQKLSGEGPLRDLFPIEDVLVSKVTRLITQDDALPSSTAPTNAAPQIQLIGPMVSPSGATSTYFDGNLSAVLTPPRRFEDKYDRFYYHSASTSGWYCGAGFGACGFLGNGFCGAGPIGFLGPQLVRTATAVSEW